MPEKTLIAKVRADETDPEILVVASPVVAVYDGAPREGIFLNPFDRVSTLKILGQRYTLRLPRDVHGRIITSHLPNARTSVAFNDPLVRLDPRALQGGPGSESRTGAHEGFSGGEAGEGTIHVNAPSEGIFYRRSSPDSPAYVEVGSRISEGTVLGLVEVMKCFNQITYGGPGLPKRGEVARIFAEDASEVQFGQPLFWIRPID